MCDVVSHTRDAQNGIDQRMAQSSRGQVIAGHRYQGKLPIRIIVVDDQESARQDLAAFVESVDDFELVGLGHDGREAVQLCREMEPDVVLIDLDMPGMKGIVAAKLIHGFAPRTRTIALTGLHDDLLLNSAFDAPFSAFLSKGIPTSGFANVIRSAEHRFSAHRSVETPK
jgi:DNA-binding NarL/FixJ family response regulator